MSTNSEFRIQCQINFISNDKYQFVTNPPTGEKIVHQFLK